ncbi:MAG: sigma-E processing peptidase SpoIIGA [Peptococcaceae bacterium]|nr:sigma-E processing peptidase SpoIIGA [Peptococcaceae bacterium]
MAETIIYLDLTFIVHTLMNVLLLLLVSRLCRRRIYPLWLAAGVLIGLIPLCLWTWDMSWQGPAVMAVVPILPAMLTVGLRVRRLADFFRCLALFVVLAAISGGGVYMISGSGTHLTPHNLWIIPTLMGAVYGVVFLWQRWHKTDEFLQQVLYKVELEFGWGSVELSALLDTGNDLKDPVTGTPVIIAEEKALRHVLPPVVQRFLSSAWQKEGNPWTLLWQSSELSQIMSFVATASVGGKRLLPAVRPQNVSIKRLDHLSQSVQPLGQKVSVLLVNQVLSAENRFQVLLHPQCVNPSGRNIGDVVQEKSCVPLGKVQESMRRNMA